MASFSFSSNFSLVESRGHDAVDLRTLVAASKPLARSLGLLKSNSGSKNWSLRACSREVGTARAASEAATAVSVDDGVVREKERDGVLRVGVICGGPSAERGISMNSARSVIDHIQGEDLHVSCYYIDCDLNAYAISTAQVYSNTPADFDFKLESLAQGFRSLSDFAAHLAASVDIAFPVIHGQFGEDGGIQELLERFNIPFVGTGSSECCQAFDKYHASMELSKLGFVTVPSFLVQGREASEAELAKWFERNQLDPVSGKVVVKPARAGSSIGVTVAYGAADSLKKASEIISEGIDDRVIVEIFLEGGNEFTAIVLDVGSGFDSHAVALLPTEVLQDLNYCVFHPISWLYAELPQLVKPFIYSLKGWMSLIW
ncbi:hypothetical protein BT93_A0544 [Corymbia citriodora subsp. variegata]|nr:hypothetical protein BT93_A0544 [Corymbia citriodora subsp. variegata]